jgi:hypothetical protein
MGEAVLLMLVCFTFVCKAWAFFWNIPNRIRNFRKGLQQGNYIQQMLTNACAAATGGSIVTKIEPSYELSINFELATICEALIAEKSGEWKALEKSANAMKQDERLRALGHIYLSKVRRHYCNYQGELHELLLSKNYANKSILPSLQNQLFLAYLRNVPNIDGAELSRRHMAILTTEVGKAHQERGDKAAAARRFAAAYELDPTNGEAACFMAETWNEATAIKRLVALLQTHPTVFDKILSINTQLNRVEIFTIVKDSLKKPNPEALYIVAVAAFSAGLIGEGIHYATQAAKAFAPLASPRICALYEDCPGTIGRDVYECNYCHARAILWKSYCPQCGRLDALMWRVVSD